MFWTTPRVLGLCVVLIAAVMVVYAVVQERRTETVYTFRGGHYRETRFTYDGQALLVGAAATGAVGIIPLLVGGERRRRTSERRTS